MSTRVSIKYNPGDFSFITDPEWATALESGYRAVDINKLWHWLTTYQPEDNKGFMFSSHPNLTIINDALDYNPHSGASWACMIRNLQFIAKHGWVYYILHTHNLK